MPIYEYLCSECNRVFSFLVKSLSEKKEPTCPKCGKSGLRKIMSRFAVTGIQRKSRSAGKNPAGEGGDVPGTGSEVMDDPRVEHEMMKLMAEAEGIDENDPRQLGRLMRRMSEITGEPVEPEMEEAMRRLENGEDPKKIEEDLGDFLDGDEGGGQHGGVPTYDDGLYDL